MTPAMAGAVRGQTYHTKPWPNPGGCLGPPSQPEATECPGGSKASLFLEIWTFGCTLNLCLGLSPQQNRRISVQIPAVWALPWSACFPFKGQGKSEVSTGVSLPRLCLSSPSMYWGTRGWRWRVFPASPVPGSFQSLTSISSRTSR